MMPPMVSLVAWAAIIFTAVVGLLCTWAAPTRRVHWTGIGSTAAVVALANLDWSATDLLAVSIIGGVASVGSALLLRSRAA